MKYKTVLLDLDGTITDSGPGIMGGVRYALEKHGMDVPGEEQLLPGQIEYHMPRCMPWCVDDLD